MVLLAGLVAAIFCAAGLACFIAGLVKKIKILWIIGLVAFCLGLLSTVVVTLIVIG